MPGSEPALNAEERSMLSGEHGEAVRDALSFQLEVGRFWGAARFVPVTDVHMMGDIEVMGDGGLDWLRRCVASGACCRVKASTNARCVDHAAVDRLGQDPEGVAKDAEIAGLLRRMGVTTTNSCIKYQTLYEPHFGERLAWGDTGTVIYANSVLGARSNFESGPAALAASLTGRVPEYGFHLDAHRRGTFVVEVDAQPDDIADWGALGKLAAEERPGYFEVPVFVGFEREPSSDQLKHLGASLASYGSMAMFHVVGITPEAPTVEAALGGRPPAVVVTVGADEIERVYQNGAGDIAADLVVFSAPQLSLHELERLAERFAGARVRPGTRVIVTTETGVLAAARRLGYARPLEEAGVTIMTGVCFYILLGLEELRARNQWRTLVTNSAKLVNVIGAHGFETALRRTDECVRLATGRGT